MFSSAVRSAARRSVVVSATATQKRAMGGGPKPEWTGIDKTVRTYFPEDWQLAAAVLSGYGVLITVARLGSGGKKKAAAEPEKPAAVAAAPTTTGIPSVESAEFEAYVETEAFTTLLDSDEQLGALTKDA